MATQGNFTDAYSGRPAYFISVSVVRHSTSGTSARWSWSIHARNPNGYTATYDLDQHPWQVTVEGTTYSGTHSLDFRSGVQTIVLGDGVTGWIDQGSGTRTINFSGSHSNVGVFGSASGSTSFVADALLTPPAAPGTPTVSSIGTDRATISWSAAARAEEYGLYVSRNSSYTDYLFQAWVGSDRSRVVTGMAPATNYWTRVRAGNAAGTGPYSGSRAFSSDPVAPSSFAAGAATVSSIPLTWARGSNGNALTGYEIQYATNSSFSGAASKTVGIVTSNTLTNLVPGTQYWVRMRAKTDSVNSGWTSALTRTTLPTVAPGLTVTPSLDGSSAVLTLTPPSGVAVDSYRIERRPTGGGTVSTYNTPTSPFTASPLTPGSSNDWRASAFIDDYQTPWTDWQTKVQPNPSTTPGDYFDGSTPDRTDVIFAWTGTANNSTSTAFSEEVLGWGTFSSGTDESGGSGVVTRTSGGHSGSFSASVTFFSDATAAGFHAGLDYETGSAVTSGGVTHDALIHVRLPGRSQRLAAMIVWLDGSGNEVGRSVGDPVSVTSSAADWTALRVTGVAPGGAVAAVVRAIDVEGPGWSLWIGGDVMLLDSAITPFGGYYFDGNTADTTEYTYSWEGAVNDSSSIRLENDVPVPDPLLDPDCPPVPSPPRPPVIDDSCAETDVTEWRRSVAAIGDLNQWTNPEWLDLIPTLSLSASADIRLVRIRYYQNPFGRPLSDIDVDAYCAEQIVTFIPAGAILTLDGISERVWAEVAGSSTTLAADHLLATQQGDTSQWPLIGCGIDYYLTIDTPIEIPAGALDAEYMLTARYR